MKIKLIEEQNDEILELFKLYMNLGNNSLFKLIILLPFCLKKILMKAPTWSYFFSFCSFNYYLSKSLFYR